jgi:hypothetical protein
MVSCLANFPPWSTHPTSLRFFLILYTQLRLGISRDFFHCGLPPIAFMYSFGLHSFYVPCQSHSLWLALHNFTWPKIQVMKLLFMHFPYPTFASSLFFLPIFSAPCSQTPPVYAISLMSETKFHTRTKPTCKIIVLNIIIFKAITEQTKKTAVFGLNGSKHLPNSDSS